MSKSFQIKISEHGTGIETRVTGEIPSAEWEKMVVFMDEVVRLEATRAVSQGLRVQFKFTVSRDTKQLQFSGSLPHEDDIVVILHRLRPFILQDEPANFHRVTNILSHHLDDSKVRDVIKDWKDGFSGKNFQRTVRIDMQSESMRTIVNSEENLTTWLNAFEFHRDVDKRREIDELCKMFPKPVLYAVFVNMLFNKIYAIQNVAMLIRTIEQSAGVPLTVAYNSPAQSG